MQKTGSLLSETILTDYANTNDILIFTQRSKTEHQNALLKKSSEQQTTSIGLQIEPTSWDYHYYYPDTYSAGWVAVNIYAKRQTNTGTSHTWDIDTVISTNPDSGNLWNTSHLALSHNVSYSGETLQQRTPASLGTPGASYGLSLTWGYPTMNWAASSDGLTNITNSWSGNNTQWDLNYRGAAASGSMDFEGATRSVNTVGSFWHKTSYTVTWVNVAGSPSYVNNSATHTIAPTDF